MTYEQEYAQDEYVEEPQQDLVQAPAPYTQPWTWSANTLLWIAGGVLAASFAVWFLMSYTKAKASALAAIAEAATNGSQ